MRFCFFIILLISLSVVISRRPTIAIYADKYSNDQFKVLSDTVNFLIASGAKTTVILPSDHKDYIDYVLSEVDGVYFQGDETKEFLPNFIYILETSIKLNKQGLKKLALWLTGTSFDKLAEFIEGKSIITTLNSNMLSSSSFDINVLKESKFFKLFNENDYQNLKNINVNNEENTKGVLIQDFNKSSKLKEFLIATTTAFDKNGKEYVNTYEAKDFPIFGIKSFPERTIYDLNISHVAASSTEAKLISKAFGNIFVQYCRESHLDDENIKLKNEKVYIFLNGKVKEFKLRLINPIIDLANTVPITGERVYLFNKN